MVHASDLENGPVVNSQCNTAISMSRGPILEVKLVAEYVRLQELGHLDSSVDYLYKVLLEQEAKDV